MPNQGKKSENEVKLKEELIKLRTELEAAKGKGLSADKLKKEYNFIEYVRMLKFFSKRYILIISACDTPCGPSYTQKVSTEVMSIGLEISLCNKFRHSYVAIIDAGELVFEKLSPTVYEPVEYSCVIDDIAVEVVSVGFAVPRNSTALIMLDGRNYSPGGRGLNFVVFDKVTKTVLDAVNFDTYSDSFPCHRLSAITEGLLSYKNAHPDVSILCFNTPAFPKNNLSENEDIILKYGIGRAFILQHLDTPVFAINKYLDTKEKVIEALNAPKSYHDINGIRRFEDVSGSCVNTAGGHRVTAGQPQKFKRTVFFLGGCNIFGIGASDKGTIASHLQKLLNELAPEQQLIVQNYGYYLAELSDAETGEELAILNALPVKAGDVILCNFAMPKELPYLDISSAASRPHNYGEVFFDTQHYTEEGYRLIADRLFEKLQQMEFFSNPLSDMRHSTPLPVKGNANGFSAETQKELYEYKKILTEFYNSMFGVTFGSVVVNCNPFTLGHRYLIEQAAAQCDHLFVFVVQEDRSIFPFDDRIKLVDDGIAHLKNVTVIPSGNFIISSLTFSEYFNKAELQDRVIDPSFDVSLFAGEIAPCLHISVRFAGEEPNDKVTKQYNDTMRAILPQYGIEFVEVPRIETDGAPISASLVRALLKEKNFDEIAKIVPKTTLDYLMARF